MFFLVIIIYYC